MKEPAPVESASAFIGEKIEELGDWRGKTLARVREIIHEADPEIVEEWKWMGTPVWSHGGIVCTGETCKNAVVRRETNSWKWPAVQFVYMGVVAYVAAYLGRFLGGLLLG